MIATGGLSPLTGFMGEADYKSVVHDMHLANGLPWTIPVTLAVTAEQAARIQPGQAVALVEQADGGERLLAILDVTEKYTYDRQDEADHPEEGRIWSDGSGEIGAQVEAVRRCAHAR